MADAGGATEQAYWNQEYASEGRALDNWYSIADQAIERYETLVRAGGVDGRTILEYGCGPNGLAVELAAEGAQVTGIDISQVAISRSEAAAALRGLESSCRFETMDAEELGFPDQSFDVICGGAILHHLDLNRAYAEVARTLKPDGRAVFLEPMGHNPLIRLYRARTPEHRTPDEHPLLIADLVGARDRFGSVRASFFHLAALAAVPLLRTPLFQPLSKGLAAADLWLLDRFPRLRKHAWMVVLELSQPTPAARPS